MQYLSQVAFMGDLTKNKIHVMQKGDFMMVKHELTRHLKSKYTFVFLIITIVIAMMSFSASLADKHVYIGQMLTNPPDLDKVRLSSLIADYNGIKFYMDFWFLSDFSTIYVLALFLWVGVFLSGQIQSQRENGYGSFIVSRLGYRHYFRCTFFSQSIYIVLMVAIGSFVQLLLALLFGGSDFTRLQIGIYEFDLSQTVFLIVVEYFQLTLLTIAINGMSLSLNVWINNKYVLRILPVVGFALLPMILGGTAANLSHALGSLISKFIPYTFLMSIYYLCQYQFSIGESLMSCTPIIIYAFIFLALYRINTRKFQENYL
jgi:hypothetical protein